VALGLALGRTLEAGIVAVVLPFNVLLALVQEGRARAALELLRSRLAVRGRVLRDGV
jgi:H+-transporting ATPase